MHKKRSRAIATQQAEEAFTTAAEPCDGCGGSASNRPHTISVAVLHVAESEKLATVDG